MAKYTLQEMPDLDGKGKRKVYPKMMVNRTIGTEELLEKMKDYNNAIPSSVIGAVIDDLGDMLVRMLSMGYNVKLDGIGSFSASLAFIDKKTDELTDDDDKMAYRKVGVRDVRFVADRSLTDRLRHETELQRAEPGVNTIRKPQLTTEEHVGKALHIIRDNGFITLGEYATANNISRTTASRELKALTQDEASPLKAQGSGSHKIWVENKR